MTLQPTAAPQGIPLQPHGMDPTAPIQPCRHKLRPTPSSTVSTAAAPQGAHSPLQPHTTTTPDYIPLQVLQPQRSPTAPQGVLLQLTTDQWGTQNRPLKPQITPQSPHAPQSSTSPLQPPTKPHPIDHHSTHTTPQLQITPHPKPYSS